MEWTDVIVENGHVHDWRKCEWANGLQIIVFLDIPDMRGTVFFILPSFIHVSVCKAELGFCNIVHTKIIMQQDCQLLHENRLKEIQPNNVPPYIHVEWLFQ